MLTVTAICDQYAWLYTTLPVPAGTWDKIIPVDGCYAAIKRINSIDYLMFRGSTTLLDWVEDFEDCALPANDPVLGDVHPGAQASLLGLKDIINSKLGDHVVIVGHSLGAMHAALMAGYRVAAGLPVDGLVMFGEPRPGGPRLSKILAHIPVESYRNTNDDGHDIVTDVARALPPMLPYQHVCDPLTDCRADPSPLDPWLAFRYHHFGLYCRAFGCGGVAAQSLSGFR